jgi:hypothetical protein
MPCTITTAWLGLFGAFLETGDATVLGTNVSVDGNPVDWTGLFPCYSRMPPRANNTLQPMRNSVNQSTVLARWLAAKRQIVPFPANKIISLPAGTEVAGRHCEIIDY